MRQKKYISRIKGLKAKFLCLFLIYGLICSLIFLSLYSFSEHVVTSYFENSDIEMKMLKKQVEDLQRYISENNLDQNNLVELKKWERKQPLIFIELYKGSDCIYSSQTSDNHGILLNSNDEPVTDHLSTIEIDHEKVTTIIYSDFAYYYYTIAIYLSFIFSLVLFLLLFLFSISKMIRYICQLEHDVQTLEGGNLDYEVTVRGNDELTNLAESMNRMRFSFMKQLQTEQEIYQSHRKLISEMSHDLKTPLTGIMLYIEILRSQRYKTEEELKSYLDKIDGKAHQMKELSEHLLEYSLDGTHRITSRYMTMENAFSIRIDSMINELKDRGFLIDSSIKYSPFLISVKEEYIDRIFENIISNITKYADNCTPIYMESYETTEYIGLIFSNTITNNSHNASGTGVGLKSIETLMNQMDGNSYAEQTETTFELTLQFQKSNKI